MNIDTQFNADILKYYVRDYVIAAWIEAADRLMKQLVRMMINQAEN